MQTPDERRLEDDFRQCDPDKVNHTDRDDPSRITRISRELEEGFELLKKYKLSATFFGSARCGVGDSIYEDATALAHKLALSNFTVITGGAGGVMQAANKGAFEAKKDSVGLNITLPNEQSTNKYLTDEKTFTYFFTRKVMLTFASEVYIYFPGGFGTFDELFEILTLIQTKKIRRIPVVLYGKEYWDPIVDLLKNHLVAKYKTISPEDLDLFVVVNSVEDAYTKIIDSVECA